MSTVRKDKQKKSYALPGKPMSSKAFAEVVKASEESGTMPWEEAKKKLAKRIAAHSRQSK